MTNQEIKTVGQTIAAETQIGGNTAERVGGVIEGIGDALDNKDAAVGYYLATMSGSTIYINASSYRLGTGGNLRAKMPAAATTACTLTVGNAQAVQLWYNGAAVSADNSWEAGEIVTIFYDGTRFMASNSQGGGGQFGSGEKIKDILLSQVLGAGTDAITSQKGVSDAIFNEIDISSIDTLKTLNDALAPSSSLKPTYYTVTATLSSVKLKVGSMAVISDNMRHVVTEIMATHYILDDAGNLTNEHSDAEIFFIYRSVKLSGGTLPDPAGTWTKWRYVNSSVWSTVAEKIKYDNSQSGLGAGNVQGALDEIQENLTELETTGGDVWENHSVGSGITNYIKSTGAWGTGGNHFLVPVSVGEIYRLITGENGTYYAWLSGTETSGTPSYTDGSTTSKKINGNATSEDLVVPPGTNYMYILRNTSSTSYIPTLQKKTFFGSLKEQVYKNKEDIEGIGVENYNFTGDTQNDLVLSDEKGNDIAQFRNGHIYTKYFRSDNIVIDGIIKHIKELYQGKKCAIVGDSISTFSGYMPSGYKTFYPQGEVSDVSECWWKIVCDVLGMTPVNCAWSGSKVTGAPKGATAAAGCSDQRIADCGRNGNPDIIIFYIGCNDWGNGVSLGTWNVNSAIIDDSEYTSSQTISDFRAAYALMLKKAKLAYPLAKIFCCTILDDVRRDSNEGYPSNNGNGVTTFTWNQSIKEVAEALGASVIDLHSCGLNFFNIVEHSVDVSKGQPAGLHPDIWGHSQMAIKVINSLIGL